MSAGTSESGSPAPESLYAMLGLSEDVDVERLRYAYEGAVSAATNRQDWTRAARLSAAFDRLPSSVRLSMYPGRDRDARRWDPADTRTAVSRPARVRHNPLRRGGALVAVLSVVTVVAVGLGVAWKARWTSNDTRRPAAAVPPVVNQPVAPPMPTISAPSVQPTSGARTPEHVYRPSGDVRLGNTGRQIEGLPLWTTPPQVPSDSHGMVTMRCSGPLGTGQWAPIDHRIAFTCPAGAAPEYLLPN